MTSYTIKFHNKKFQSSCILGESCFKFQMKCLNCGNFVTAHAFLTGRHLFIFFTVAPFLCALLVILDFCFILVTSNTVISTSLFGALKFKLEVKDFIFHGVVFSRETFQTLAWKFLLCIPQNVFGVYIFPNFVLVQYIAVQKSVKTYPSLVYTLFVFFNFHVACNCSNSSKQETKHSYYNLPVKGEKYQLDLSKLLMSRSDCF